MGKRLKGGKKEAIMIVLILLVLIKIYVGEPNPPSLPPTPLPRRLVSLPEPNDLLMLKELLKKAHGCFFRCQIKCGRHFHPNSCAYLNACDIRTL